MTTTEAVKHLATQIESDESYYYTWQSNIAMAFYDEYNKAKDRNYIMGNKVAELNIHEVSNKAAIRFLNSLIIEVKNNHNELG